MPDPEYVVEIDADGDGVYQPADDVLRYARADGTPTAWRGLDAGRIISPPEAGALVLAADNRDGQFASGTGRVRGRRIRLRETGAFDGTPRPVWAGIVQEVARQRTREDSVATVRALGVLSLLAGKSIATALYENVRTDQALAVICDEAGVPRNVAEYVLRDVAVAPWLYWILDGDASDASGNGNDGTAEAGATFGGPVLDDEGRESVSLAAAANGRITLASGNGMPVGSGARSIMFRYRATYTAPGNIGLCGMGPTSPGFNETFNLQRIAAGNDRLYLWATSNDVTLYLGPTIRTNYVGNSGFVSDASGWSGSAGGSVARSTAAARTGPASLLITTGASAGSGGRVGGGSWTISVPAGETRTYSGYVRGVVGGESVILQVLDADGGFAVVAASSPVTLSASEWTRITVTYTAAATRQYLPRFATAGGAISFYMDDAQVEGGAEATAYIENHTGAAFSVSDGVNIGDGEDHTIIVTLADDGRTVRVFYDGEEGVGAVFAVALNTADGITVLGQPSNAGAYAQSDKFAHFAIWDGHAITPAEARAIHARFLSAPRRFDTGLTTLRQWWLGSGQGTEDAFAAALALQWTEGPGAWIFEDETGAIVFRNRHSLVLRPRSTSVQFAYSDTAQPSPSDSSIGDAEADAINYAEIRTVRREAQTLGVVWTYGETVTLGADEEIVIPASFGSTLVGGGIAGDPLINAATPTSGDGDYTIAAGSLASLTLDRDSGGIIPIRIRAGAGGLTLTGLRLRAQRYAIASTTIVQSRTTPAGLAPEEIKPWSKPIRPEIAPGDAQSIADAIPGWYSEGIETVRWEVRGDNATKIEAQLDTQIGDRVSITDQFLDLAAAEVYVLSVRHTLAAGGLLLVTEFEAERALANVYGTWDAGLWDAAVWGW